MRRLKHLYMTLPFVRMSYWLCLAGAVMSLSCGCISSRFTSTITRQESASDETFHLQSVSFSLGDRKYPAILSDQELASGTAEVLGGDVSLHAPVVDADALRQALSQLAETRYPNLLTTEERHRSISIEFAFGDEDNWEALSVVGLLTLGTLPTYVSVAADVGVCVSILRKDGGRQTGDYVHFVRKDATWITLFLPLGLLPVPGHTDRDRTTGLLAYSRYRKGGVFTLECILDATVRSLKTAQNKPVVYTPIAPIPAKTTSPLPQTPQQQILSPQIEHAKIQSTTFKVVTYKYDAKDHKGVLAVDMAGRNLKEVRDWVVENIGEISSSKELLNEAGQEHRTGGKYRLLDESIHEGILTVHFTVGYAD